jgi:hypothetical protein
MALGIQLQIQPQRNHIVMGVAEAYHANISEPAKTFDSKDAMIACLRAKVIKLETESKQLIAAHKMEIKAKEVEMRLKEKEVEAKNVRIRSLCN